MRIRESGIEADGGFVIFIGGIDAAEFGFGDADKILKRCIGRPRAPRSLKLFERPFIIPLLKERDAALQRIALPRCEEGQQKRRQREYAEIHCSTDFSVVIWLSS